MAPHFVILGLDPGIQRNMWRSLLFERSLRRLIALDSRIEPENDESEATSTLPHHGLQARLRHDGEAGCFNKNVKL